MTHARAVVILLVGATLISFSPVLVKFAADRSLGPTAIGFWRTLGGGVILFAIAGVRHKRLRLHGPALGFSVLAGFFFSIDLFCWHRSIMYSGAGMATILANTQVFATVVLSYFAFRERVSGSFLAVVVSAFIGVVLLVGIGSTGVVFTERYIAGILFGLGTGLAYANYIIALKKGRISSCEPSDSLVFIAWTSLFSAFFLGLASLFEEAAFVSTDPVVIVSVLGLGLLVQALGWWAITAALPRVKTARAGLVLLLQPTLAMLWGVIIFSESLTLLQSFGAMVTLVAMYLGGLRRQPTDAVARHK